MYTIDGRDHMKEALEKKLAIVELEAEIRSVEEYLKGLQKQLKILKE